ncbi:alpha/beta hydrolase [Taibaiella lutea]|uniref:Alpha/beta hydrolase n=1 Tax=Taibaiella lutea TaxID=2608001 RepID=A0A5M6CIM2_9BACT|nr:alpha/beta hydrolase [Taibaiella lutea]KAA5534876.1 alpha/beta hydrolase [Taibaiella lutea]
MTHTITNNTITIRDFELNIQQGILHPENKTIVFLHDSLGCNALWRSFPEQLAASSGLNYMMYDRRGYGLSDPFSDEQRTKDYMEAEATILMELLEQLHIENPVLFGHSDGGTIALIAAAKHPDAFTAVITEGAHVFVEEITLDGIAHTKYQYQTTNLKERLQKYHGNKTEALFHAWTETWLRNDFRDWNIEHFLPAITCPVMVIQGVEDEFGSYEQVQFIANNTSGAKQICMVNNAGHSPHKQSELWLINECCRFLEDSARHADSVAK